MTGLKVSPKHTVSNHSQVHTPPIEKELTAFHLNKTTIQRFRPASEPETQAIISSYEHPHLPKIGRIMTKTTMLEAEISQLMKKEIEVMERAAGRKKELEQLEQRLAKPKDALNEDAMEAAKCVDQDFEKVGGHSWVESQ